ncbi:HTH-type transcriptional regulator CysL [Achromobacter mucicolens]|uniref:LysR family transcriptional regulator n=1 Tax=Achromobacter mucicolens TaxID=1389922 RepID=UPI0009C76194|nr:LysR family transcriptional regulator [Achromobacter mucicolens]MDG9970040.1 LysR family transcriptional regulator [Achromobacter mucicolens]OXC92003.1 LysR family transcriptional regulator [Achromobacter sp. KAs 3-5]WBX91331.1 LysR family transcriptional regulator [Achromobacter mucicolens]CAB3633324.1 HTH-type transcriptional regulator CysL [Achromobacter mucicolens]
MDLKHIRTFAAVAREGNLTRAAEHLHLTQPALSLQLKNFQESLDLTLFTRTAQGLAPNADGRALLAPAQRVLDALDDFQRAIGALRDTVQGELRIGTILDPEFLRLGATLQYLVEHYPKIRPTLRHGMSGSVGRQVRAGDLDVGFYLGPPQPSGLHAQPLASFSYYVVAPKGWSAQVAGRGWAEIAALPWIWTPPDSVHHRLLSDKFDALGITPHAVAEVDQEASMLDLVRSGVGLSLARDSIALRESQSSGLQLVKGLSIQAELSFITQTARRDDPLVAAAFAAVQAAFA